MSNHNETEFLTFFDAARFLGVTTNTVTKWVKEKDGFPAVVYLDPLRKGNARLRKSDLVEWIYKGNQELQDLEFIKPTQTLEDTKMELLYKIEKRVPVPEVKQENPWRDLANAMEDGDSVVVKNNAEAERLYLYLRKEKGEGWKATRRKVEKGYRVWAIREAV